MTNQKPNVFRIRLMRVTSTTTPETPSLHFLKSFWISDESLAVFNDKIKRQFAIEAFGRSFVLRKLELPLLDCSYCSLSDGRMGSLQNLDGCQSSVLV